MKQRDVILVILLSLITCGIYTIYWIIVTTDEIEATLRNKDGSVSNGGVVILFTIITCGIYGIYWYYKQGQRIAQLEIENNLSPTDQSLIFLILSLFGLQIIAMVLLQSALNKIVVARS